MKFVKQFAQLVTRLGHHDDRATCPLYATEHPAAKGVSLTAEMLEARVGR